jgi:hypothetical protein
MKVSVRAIALVALVAAALLLLPASAFGVDRIFWGNFDFAKIGYANLDGSGAGGDVNTTGASTPVAPWGVALDPAAGRIY